MDEGLTTRDGAGKYKRTLDSVQRDLEACRLRDDGWTLQRISDELGYGSKGNVWKALKTAYAEVRAPGVEKLRNTQLAEIDYLKQVLLEVLDSDHYVVTQAGIIVHKDGEPLIDQGPLMQAVAHYKQLLEREAKIVGSDAPQQRVVTLDDLHAERARLLAEAAEYDDEEDEDLEDEAEPEDDEA